MIIPSSIQNYLSLLDKYPYLKGELKSSSTVPLKIILEKEQILEIQENIYQENLQKGLSPEQAKEQSQAGLVYCDAYIYVVRDPVIFPDQSKGLYKRIILKCTLSKKNPVAILAKTPDEKIVLIKTWRHATQKWEIEIPRGAPEENEFAEETAIRELYEETGYQTKNIFLLGNVKPDSGILEYQVSVYLAEAAPSSVSQFDPKEIIQTVFTISLKNLNQAISQGYLEDFTSREKYPIQDPFLIFGLYQAHLRGVLNS